MVAGKYQSSLVAMLDIIEIGGEDITLKGRRAGGGASSFNI